MLLLAAGIVAFVLAVLYLIAQNGLNPFAEPDYTASSAWAYATTNDQKVEFLIGLAGYGLAAFAGFVLLPTLALWGAHVLVDVANEKMDEADYQASCYKISGPLPDDETLVRGAAAPRSLPTEMLRPASSIELNDSRSLLQSAAAPTEL